MKQYTITRVSGNPDWSQIPALDVDYYQWSNPIDVKMKAQLCYDETGIHAHLQAWEKDIRAECTEPLSMVCEDSCMEFFFRPMDGDFRYFNLEINPIGRTYIGFGPNVDQLIRLAIPEEDALMKKVCNYTEDGWEVFFTFPVSVIDVFFPGYELKPGMKIYANCYKCGDLTNHKHHLAWNPLVGDNRTFHLPEQFGLMELG